MKSKFQELSSINISSLINENTARIMMSGILNFSARERFKEVTDLNNTSQDGMWRLTGTDFIVLQI